MLLKFLNTVAAAVNCANKGLIIVMLKSNLSFWEKLFTCAFIFYNVKKKPYGYSWNCNFGEALTLRERSLGTKLFLVRIRENTDHRKLCIQILFTMCYPCLSQIWDNFILNPKIKLLDVRPNLCLNFYFYIIGWKFTLHFFIQLR